MDPISIITIAALVGYSIFEEFKDTPEKKAARDKIERELENARIEEENRKRIQSVKFLQEYIAQRREQKGAYQTARECFQKQYVSYARISTYNTCPTRFKIIYLDKEHVFQSRYDSLHRGKGEMFHAAMEKYFKKYIGRIVIRPDYKEIIEEIKQDIESLPEEKRDDFRDNVRFLCDTFPNNTEIVAVEQELSFKVNDINFYGIVDLVIKYPDGHLEIVDFKTGLIPPIKEQLEIYSIPFTNKQGNFPIGFRFICVDRQSHYIWSHNRDGTLESTNNILNIVNIIINDADYLPLISSHCRNCSVRLYCEYTKKYRRKKSKKRLSNKRLLTRIRAMYEWKLGQELPKNTNDNYKEKKQKTPVNNKGDGRSFSLSKAKQEYNCLKTKRTIRKDEFHFVDHKGNRYCIDAFMELYPDRANRLLEEAISQSKGDKGLSFSLSKAKEDHRCLEYLPSCKPIACCRCCTQRVIKKGEYHFVNHKGKRYCIDAFKELYPDRTDSLIKPNINF